MILGELSVHFALPDAVESLREDAALRIVELSAGPRDEKALLRDLGRALALPDYYGENWDALDECLRDLETDALTVLVIEGAGHLWSSAPRAARMLVDVWLSAASERGGDLHLVLVW